MTRHFSDFLTAYVETFAPRSEAPERFHYWCAVHTIAGALRRRVYIDEGTFRWYPNFYIILIGPPGTVKKSTTINVGARLIREMPGAFVGSDCTTWQAFVEEVAQARDMFAEGDPEIVADPVDLINLSEQQKITCAISFQISEFGTFFNPLDREMVNVLTELYDCKIDQAFTKRTKTQGSDTLMNPFVNIIAGTTPKWMNDNFRGQFGGWGLSSRCIFLHASEPSRMIAYPHKVWKDDFTPTMERFQHDLREIAALQGSYRITPEAEELGEAWYIEHSRRKVALDSHPNHDPWLSYYLARKWDHIHKLAIIISSSCSSTMRISADSLGRAIARCDEIEDELSQIFHSRDSSDKESSLRMDVWNAVCLQTFRHSLRLPEHILQSIVQRFMSYGKAKEFIDGRLATHYLVRGQAEGDYFYSFGDAAEFDTQKMTKYGVPTELLELVRSQQVRPNGQSQPPSQQSDD